MRSLGFATCDVLQALRPNSPRLPRNATHKAHLPILPARVVADGAALNGLKGPLKLLEGTGAPVYEEKNFETVRRLREKARGPTGRQAPPLLPSPGPRRHDRQVKGPGVV